MAMRSPTKRLATWLAVLSAEFIVLSVLLGIALILVAYMIDLVFIKKGGAFDDSVFNFVAQYVTPARTRFMLFMTFFGNHMFLVPANLMFLTFFLFKRNPSLVVRVAAIALSSLGLKLLLKNMFHRIRPDNPLIEGGVAGFSFPSGHALMSASFYGLLIYITWLEVKIKWVRNLIVAFLVLLILTVSFTRIYLRVHYTTDVIAGLAIGFIWLVSSIALFNYVQRRQVAKKTKTALETAAQPDQGL
jgi:membrane-associated phospholipid phosphatase